MNDTIAAISTTLGVGAISIIRISGLEAIKEVNKITKTNILDKESHTITYTYIEDNNETIDEVLVTIMKAPKTFTREDIVEINCHGGIATTKKVLELLLKQNIRLAEPGEFTKRAFLNGRIDLTQAEAVMDLINVKSDTARQIAISNLKGNTTKKIRTLREKLSDILANIEVNIDYPEYQDIEEMTTKKIKNELDNIKNELDKIIENSKNSKIIKDLPFVVNASYTQNEKTILPTIKVWLKGNTDDEKKDVTGIEQVKVTATESYNVKIKKGDKLWGVRQKLNYDGNEITGRMFGIGIATTLYNNSNIQKGARGKTVPSGKIEINTSIKILNDDGEDITSNVNPLIWNYSLNGGNGIIPDRNMYFSVNNTQRYRYFPFGKLQSGYTTSSVYDSGKVNITQNGNIITTTIEDYKFNGQFPQATIAQTLLEANEGYFASLYLQIIVPETEYKGNYTIVLNEGGEEETKVVKINGIQKVQARSDDDHIETKVDTTIKGEYGHVIVPLKDKGYKNTKYLVDGNYNPTHAEVTKNQIFVEEFRIQQSSLDVRS